MALVRIVVKEQVPEGDLATFEVAQRWYFTKFHGKTGTRHVTKQLKTRDGQTFIKDVKDLALQTTFLVVEGQNIEPVVEAIREKVEVYSPAEIEKMLKATGKEDYERRVVRVGLAAPADYDSAYFDFLKTALADDKAAIRQVAILVSQVVGWAEFKPLLEKIGQSDPDQELQKLAQQSLDTLGQLQIS